MSLQIFQMIFSSLTKPKQHVFVQEIPQGQVLDIGGGGEGVIAQVGGARIVVVDKYLSEVNEAKSKSPASFWMVADATTLPCKSRCIDHATAFFSCMYMSDEVKERVFRETYRLLNAGGEFWIWDANMVSKGTVFAIRLQVEFSDHHKTNTAYGVKAKDQSAASIGGQLQAIGFEWEVVSNQKQWFLIKARKA